MASGHDSSVLSPAPLARGQRPSATGRAAPSNWLAPVFANLPALAFLALLIVAWEAYVVIFKVNDFILPAPSKVLAVTIRLFPLLMAHTWTTTYEILLGFLLGNGFAVLMALLIVNSRLAERVFYPLIIASQTVPKVAIAPLFLIWLGSGLQPKIIIAAIVCFFPTVVNTVQGLRATDPNAIDLLRLVAASRRQVFLKLQFPNALPYFFAGLKISIALAVIGAIIGEWVGANSGLGYLIMFSTQTMRTDLMFAALVLTALLGVLLYLAVVLLERLLSWSPSDMPVGGL
jgi:NitT/TauT family transport system permease protein